MAEPQRQVFSAVLQSGHKQDAVEVPFDPAHAWGIAPVVLWRGRRGHRVHVDCSEVSFDSAVVSRSRRHWLLVEDEVRERAGWQVGDTLALALRPAASA